MINLCFVAEGITSGEGSPTALICTDQPHPMAPSSNVSNISKIKQLYNTSHSFKKHSLFGDTEP